jgi:phospholipid transport system transporter-binding protein
MALASPATLALPARLTMGEARATLAQLQQALTTVAAGAPLVIDASALAVLDTAAVAVLLDCQRSAHLAGRRLQVQGAPDKLADLARLYGVDGLLGLGSPPNA